MRQLQTLQAHRQLRRACHSTWRTYEPHGAEVCCEKHQRRQAAVATDLMCRVLSLSGISDGQTFFCHQREAAFVRAVCTSKNRASPLCMG
jgi:hypothetical protein